METFTRTALMSSAGRRPMPSRRSPAASTARSCASKRPSTPTTDPYLYTSYNAATGGGIVNQVQQVYNGLSQLITEYQAGSGAVNINTTPKVQYAWNELAGGANN